VDRKISFPGSRGGGQTQAEGESGHHKNHGSKITAISGGVGYGVGQKGIVLSVTKYDSLPLY